jgi:hypothetical protein
VPKPKPIIIFNVPPYWGCGTAVLELDAEGEAVAFGVEVFVTTGEDDVETVELDAVVEEPLLQPVIMQVMIKNDTTISKNFFTSVLLCFYFVNAALCIRNEPGFVRSGN